MLSSMRARISQRQAPMPYLYSYYHTYNHTCTYIHVHTRSNPFMHGYHPFTNGCHPFTHRWQPFTNDTSPLHEWVGSACGWACLGDNGGTSVVTVHASLQTKNRARTGVPYLCANLHNCSRTGTRSRTVDLCSRTGGVRVWGQTYTMLL